MPMHNNYYFFRNLSIELNFILKEAILKECFSMIKDELVMRILLKNNEQLWIKILLLPDTTLLSFPTDFCRSKRNSINLFDELINKKIVGLSIFEQERYIGLNFEKNYLFLIQAFGKNNNLIFLKNNKVNRLFKKNEKFDMEKSLRDIIKIRKSISLKNIQEYGYLEILPSLNKTILDWFDKRKNKSFKDSESLEKWEAFQVFLKYIEKPKYYIVRLDNKIKMLFYPLGEIILETKNILEAYTRFFNIYVVDNQLKNEKNNLLKIFQKDYNRTQKYLLNTQKNLKNLQSENHYRVMGDILMANLNEIPAYSSEVSLLNFYTQKNTTVKLVPHLSPQKNAAKYYQKAKNEKIAIQILEQNIASKKEWLLKLKIILKEISDFRDLKSLRRYTYYKSIKTNTQKPQQTKHVPYREITFDGFLIWIGKSAKDNDELLRSHSHKNDLWLHAKDSKGSHVIVKLASHKDYTKKIIEEAASWAAAYSSRKHENIAPVSYCLRKYVRKNKNMAIGQVIIEREEVIMAVPKER